MYKNIIIVLCFIFVLGIVIAHGQTDNPNLIYCNKISANTISAGTVEIISGIANKHIHVCGWTLNSVTVNPTVQFIAGDGPTCAGALPDSVTYLLGSAGSITVNHLATAFISVPAGVSVCVVVTGAGNPSVYMSFYYAQF